MKDNSKKRTTIYQIENDDKSKRDTEKIARIIDKTQSILLFLCSFIIVGAIVGDNWLGLLLFSVGIIAFVLKLVFVIIVPMWIKSRNKKLVKNAVKKLADSKNITEEKNQRTDILMMSQLAALCIEHKDEKYQQRYIDELIAANVPEKDAQLMFEFDCEVIKKYKKQYLLNPDFTRQWIFGLKEPFFKNYPQTKEEILKERFLTMSELCKIVDEAEWHFWNSHEREMPDEVWSEIYAWRLQGKGMEFALKYFDMISEVTGMTSESVSKICGMQGTHLSKYKW